MKQGYLAENHVDQKKAIQNFNYLEVDFLFGNQIRIVVKIGLENIVELC